MFDNRMEQEVREAIYAGERALSSLRAAQQDLNSARVWGVVDMFGGGFITDMIKHSKMNSASSHMETAKYDLRAFQKELRDVSIHTELNMDVSDFLTFADFFFDGIIADYMVQSKIADARKQVADAIRQVEDILAQLRSASY